jgi:UPF0755 protein
MQRVIGTVVLALLLLGGGAAAAVWWAGRAVHTPLPITEPLIITVATGSNLAAVGHELAAHGAMPHPRAWYWYARARGLAQKIQAGEYEIRPGATPLSVLDEMVRGEVILHSLTIVEGTNFRDLLQLLAAQPPLKHTLTRIKSGQIMRLLGAAGTAPEGQFFPDTYRFAAGTSDLEILKRAQAEMQRRLAAAWEARAADLPLPSPYQALILASMIEKETALPAERPRIAGVFLRRLRLGMRLQSDPTVIYGLGIAYNGDIHKRDLLGDTPYNTYTRDGLPPTPIALPGAAALQAATHPEDTGSIYFVATGESDGSHYFSATLEEHNAAVRRYLARTRGQRSSHL